MITIPEFLLGEVPEGATHMSKPEVSWNSGGRIQCSFLVYRHDTEKGWLRYYRDGDKEYPEWVRDV